MPRFSSHWELPGSLAITGPQLRSRAYGYLIPVPNQDGALVVAAKSSALDNVSATNVAIQQPVPRGDTIRFHMDETLVTIMAGLLRPRRRVDVLLSDENLRHGAFRSTPGPCGSPDSQPHFLDMYQYAFTY